MDNKFGLPEACLKFLAANGGEPFKVSEELLDITDVVFYRPEELSDVTASLRTWDYHHNHGEFDEDPEWEYKLPCIDLIKEDVNDDYDAEVLLVWFPDIKCFGSCDNEHGIVYVFPNASWEKIEERLADYLNCQWSYEADPEMFFMLKPWKDQGFGDVFEKYKGENK